MFVGHYAVALALKKFEHRISLGVLFLAVQFVDILFMPLVLIGVEHMNVVPNFTESTHLELEYMPFTHSLVGSLFWAALAYAVFRWLIVRRHSAALVVALAVFSHRVLDLLTHTPDLPLWTDATLKVGLGFWNSAAATFSLEAIFLFGALWRHGHFRNVARTAQHLQHLRATTTRRCHRINRHGPVCLLSVCGNCILARQEQDQALND
jgi:hypothetical protein